MNETIPQVEGAPRAAHGIHARALARRRCGMLLGAAALAAVAALPLHAQSGDGYLFGAPAATVTLRGGFSQATARGELFDELRQDLTLGRASFAGFSGGVELAARVASSLDLTADVGYMRSNAPSHYRDFVDAADGSEIEQTTALSRVPLTLGAKLYLADRGRSVGRFAWIPAALTPYVGVSGGALWYRLRQSGDFLNFATGSVRTMTLNSDGWTPMAQAMAGIDYTISPRLAITGDARYLMAKRATLEPLSYQGYEPIDLSGATLSLGLTVRL